MEDDDGRVGRMWSDELIDYDEKGQVERERILAPA